MYFITDYIEKPDIERKILGKPLEIDQRAGARVLLVWHEIIDENYLSVFTDLEGVVRYGVGYDNIDLSALATRNIVFCNTPDYGVDEVSDTTVAMILNISRGVFRYDFLCRSYQKERWQEETIPSLLRNSDLHIGVIGAGRIGGSVCRKLNAVGFNVSIFDPYVPSGHEKMLGVKRAFTLTDLLATCDQISIHVPLTSETRGMVTDEFISAMKPGAALINTARGGIVESLDVIEKGLCTGHLGSVALDVLPDEPPDFGHGLIKSWKNNEEWLDGRLIINPHAAYFSQRAFKEMREKAAMNVKRILNGEKPTNVIQQQ
ncbi:MAG: C-terminal binding protein [Dehalococcoidia bacterium]|nr:C-terminal binding protein [Dehalococcoidia bacterium]